MGFQLFKSLQVKTGDLNSIIKASPPYIVLCDSKSVEESHINGLATQLLSDNELDIFEERKKLLAKKEYITSRFLIKSLISKHLNIDYRTLTLCFNHTLKKLQAKANSKLLPINISLAHSKGMVFFVIDEESISLGIDIEYQDSNRDIITLSKNFFHPSECIVIAHDEQEKFYQLWTLKESLAKATKQSIFELLAQNTMQIIKDFNYQVALYDGFQLALIYRGKFNASTCYLLNLDRALQDYDK